VVLSTVTWPRAVTTMTRAVIAVVARAVFATMTGTTWEFFVEIVIHIRLCRRLISIYSRRFISGLRERNWCSERAHHERSKNQFHLTLP
jgi:hypothetical protein